MNGTFLYFSYGSNLLRQRIRLRNPSAIFQSIAKAENYKLDFNWYGPRWGGAVADIRPSPGDHVWGVVWQLSNAHKDTLDKQEDVDTGIYRPFDIDVVYPDGSQHICRCYQQCLDDYQDRRPSNYYLDVIIRGALQNRLPQDYVGKLRTIQVNEYSEHCQVYEDCIQMLKEEAS